MLRIWETIEIERFVPSWRGLIGRPPHERAALARALVPTTVALVDRLALDTTLRQLCRFDLRKKKMPGEHLFSRAFKEFSAQGLMQQAHEALIKAQLSDQLISHIARDSTVIEAREKPLKRAKAATPAAQRKRGRPCKGDVRPDAEPTRIERQAAGIVPARHARRVASGVRCGQQDQQPRLQSNVDRIQAASGCGRWPDPHQRGAHLRQYP